MYRNDNCTSIKQVSKAIGGNMDVPCLFFFAKRFELKKNHGNRDYRWKLETNLERREIVMCIFPQQNCFILLQITTHERRVYFIFCKLRYQLWFVYQLTLLCEFFWRWMSWNQKISYDMQCRVPTAICAPQPQRLIKYYTCFLSKVIRLITEK